MEEYGTSGTMQTSMEVFAKNYGDSTGAIYDAGTGWSPGWFVQGIYANDQCAIHDGANGAGLDGNAQPNPNPMQWSGNQVLAIYGYKFSINGGFKVDDASTGGTKNIKSCSDALADTKGDAPLAVYDKCFPFATAQGATIYSLIKCTPAPPPTSAPTNAGGSGGGGGVVVVIVIVIIVLVLSGGAVGAMFALKLGPFEPKDVDEQLVMDEMNSKQTASSTMSDEPDVDK